MNSTALHTWLTKISQANPYPQDIVLGLERVHQVLRYMSWKQPSCPVVIVSGTNGKGSCVASLSAIYRSHGYRVGAFTSPILFQHNEMLQINNGFVSDAEFCLAYEKIFALQNNVPLTPFEYHTLAAIEILQQHSLDIWIMEVGLGGRLDAVNCLDADVAVITSIDFDHMDYLGYTRDAIATEKAGILRNNKPAVCGDNFPPQTLLNIADHLNTELYVAGRDFKYRMNHDSTWDWYGPCTSLLNLPIPQLAISNIATSLMTVTLLQNQLTIDDETMCSAVSTVNLPGRMQRIYLPQQPIHIIDVAHNPASLELLKQELLELKQKHKIHVIFSMLKDKDIFSSIISLAQVVDYWHVAPLSVPRGASIDLLNSSFSQANITTVKFYANIERAYNTVLQCSVANDIIVVCGSFHTVAELANAAPNLKNLLLNSTLCTRK